MALFLATAGVQPNDEEKKRIRGQILEQLENEKLELQEAIKKHITVAPSEVDNQINHMLSDNHLTIVQLREVLSNAGASETALRTQLTAQIAWEKTVSQEYQDRINISPAEVDAELSRYAEGADKPHYLVSEIFFTVDNPDKDAEALKTAQSVEEQLKSGGNFALVARQFSQSPSAASGGDIGWVHEGQLAPELNGALTKMTVNTRVAADPLDRRLLHHLTARPPGTDGHQDHGRGRSFDRSRQHPAAVAPAAAGGRFAIERSGRIRDEDRQQSPRRLSGLRDAAKGAGPDRRRGLYESRQHETRRSQPGDSEGAWPPPIPARPRCPSCPRPASS